jgi:hypothetical protein
LLVLVPLASISYLLVEIGEAREELMHVDHAELLGKRSELIHQRLQ